MALHTPTYNWQDYDRNNTYTMVHKIIIVLKNYVVSVKLSSLVDIQGAPKITVFVTMDHCE